MGFWQRVGGFLDKAIEVMSPQLAHHAAVAAQAAEFARQQVETAERHRLAAIEAECQRWIAVATGDQVWINSWRALAEEAHERRTMRRRAVEAALTGRW